MTLILETVNLFLDDSTFPNGNEGASLIGEMYLLQIRQRIELNHERYIWER